MVIYLETRLFAPPCPTGFLQLLIPRLIVVMIVIIVNIIIMMCIPTAERSLLVSFPGLFSVERQSDFTDAKLA